MKANLRRDSGVANLFEATTNLAQFLTPDLGSHRLQIEGAAVEFGLNEVVAAIYELEREEWLCGVHQQTEEDLVALPQREVEEAAFVNPLQIALVACGLLTAPVGSGEEVHVFAGPYVADEGNNAAVLPARDRETCLLAHFAQHALVGAFVGFALAAYANPFVVAGVVGLLDAVEHQVLVAAFHIAEGCLFHDAAGVGMSSTCL